jgi:hypothetical protein
VAEPLATVAAATNVAHVGVGPSPFKRAIRNVDGAASTEISSSLPEWTTAPGWGDVIRIDGDSAITGLEVNTPNNRSALIVLARQLRLCRCIFLAVPLLIPTGVDP